MKTRIHSASVRGERLRFSYRDIRPERGMMKDLLRREAYMKEWERLFGRFTPGGRCIDIGANIGICTVIFEKVFGMSVEAYEPVPWTAELLRKNVARNGCSAKVIEAAVLDHDNGVDVRYDHISFASASVWSEKKRVAKVVTRNAVGVVSGGAALLKLDCEGAEFPILESCDLAGVGAVIGEFHPKFSTNFGPRLLKIKERLAKDYSVHEFADGPNVNLFCKRK